MRERELFKKNYPELNLSEEAKQKLYELPKQKKSGRTHNLRRVAAILTALCIVGAGGVGYAASNGYIFNSSGHKYKAQYYVNGEEKHLDTEVTQGDDFKMVYKDRDSEYQSEAQGNKDYTIKVISIETKDEAGNEQAWSKELKLDTRESVEEQIWDIRSQVIPMPQKAEKVSQDFLAKLRKTGETLGGVWQQGIDMALEDYRKINLGHMIIIEEIKAKNGKSAWIYLDIENPEEAQSQHKKITVESVAGEKGRYDVTLGNGGYETIELHRE